MDKKAIVKDKLKKITKYTGKTALYLTTPILASACDMGKWGFKEPEMWRVHKSEDIPSPYSAAMSGTLAGSLLGALLSLVLLAPGKYYFEGVKKDLYSDENLKVREIISYTGKYGLGVLSPVLFYSKLRPFTEVTKDEELHYVSGRNIIHFDQELGEYVLDFSFDREFNTFRSRKPLSVLTSQTKINDIKYNLDTAINTGNLIEIRTKYSKLEEAINNHEIVLDNYNWTKNVFEFAVEKMNKDFKNIQMQLDSLNNQFQELMPYKKSLDKKLNQYK